MKKYITFVAFALMAVSCLALVSCSDESNNNKDPAKPDTPVTPVDEGDWQTVPASGGTIKKGDIALTFPAGTFDTDTKVAITEVEKGKVGDKLEASPFYQITMPATTANSVTVRMKSSNTNENISYIIRTGGWATSLLEEVQHDSYLKTNYTNGEYTTTLPVFENGKDPGYESFTIGLGYVPQIDDDTSTKSTTRSDWKNSVLKSGNVDGVTWEIYVGWKAWWKWGNHSDTIIRAKLWTDSIAKYIEASIKQIHKLGFRLEGKDRTIYYYYNPLTEEWGTHEQDWMHNNWWSCINLSAQKLAECNIYDPTPVDIQQTIIHETLHYYQSDYDPRYWSVRKGLIPSDDEYVALAEMGAVWIEKFMNRGKLNGNFQLSSGLANCLDKKFRLGFPCDKEDIVALADDKNKNKAYQELGYAMAPLLYYMIETDRYRDDESVLRLYTDWKSEDTPASLIGGVITKPTVERLDRWYDSTFGFFNAESLDNYYLSLFKGEVVEDFSITNGSLWLRAEKILDNKFGKDSLVGKVYPNGCEGYMIRLKNFAPADIENYELVVKQKEKGVHTHVLYTETSQTIKQIPDKTMIGDSIVITGKMLKSMMETKRNPACLLFLTTRNDPFYRDKGTVPTNTWFELRKSIINVKPAELTFEAEGGTQEAKITAQGFSRFGVRVDKAYSSWLSATPAKGGKVTVTAKANSTREQRTGYVKCYVAKSADAPESEWVWLTPIKVIQKAGNGGNEGNEGNEGKEGWWLVDTQINRHEDTTRDNGQFVDYMNYTASETNQSMTGMCTGLKNYYEYVQQPVSFVSTIQAPPAWIEGGETLVLHCTVERTSPEAYCHLEVGPWMTWESDNSQSWATKTNVVGGEGVGTRDIHASYGEWDFELYISKGSKDQKKRIIFGDACRSQIHWIYRWGNSSNNE